MFNIYCKAIESSDHYGINKGNTYQGIYDEGKDNFCVTTGYDNIICNYNGFKQFFQMISAEKI